MFPRETNAASGKRIWYVLRRAANVTLEQPASLRQTWHSHFRRPFDGRLSKAMGSGDETREVDLPTGHSVQSERPRHHDLTGHEKMAEVIRCTIGCRRCSKRRRQETKSSSQCKFEPVIGSRARDAKGPRIELATLEPSKSRLWLPLLPPTAPSIIGELRILTTHPRRVFELADPTSLR